MIRDRCNECDCTALIIDGRFACCNARHSAPPVKVKRMTSPGSERHLPPLKIRRGILASQGERCLYCHRAFGARVAYHGRWRLLRLNWDHLVPFVFSQDNSWSNFGAACDVCNGWKSSTIFRTIDDVRVYVAELWAHEEKRGINKVPTDGIERAGDDS